MREEKLVYSQNVTSNKAKRSSLPDRSGRITRPGFRTPTDLYLVTGFMSGGELLWHLQKEGRFNENRAKSYFAELILALEHLHEYDIVSRDLKRENILLDANGHIAVCDFSLSKGDLTRDHTTASHKGPSLSRYWARSAIVSGFQGSSSPLWCPGILGSGKTTLTSLDIDSHPPRRSCLPPHRSYRLQMSKTRNRKVTQ